MRRIVVFALLMAGFAAFSSAQKRLVLIEEFTNVGCGPCASWSPELDSLIRYRLGDCIAIKYHSGYPEKNDPYYLYDREAHQARVDFYNVTGVPATFVDGQELGVRTFSFLSQAVSYSQQQAPAFTIGVQKELSGQQLTVQASATALTDIGDASQLRLFVAAIEEHIKKGVPYSNGERELYYTMRKMLTPAEGYALTDGPLATGAAAAEWQGQWEADFFDDLGELGVVAFVQDMTTRQVLAAAYSGPKVERQDQLALISLSDTPDLICKPEFGGTVILRNDGANAITSATLNVRVNGATATYPWTGHLDYLDRDTLTFGGFTAFELSPTSKNAAEVWFSGVNGTEAVSNSRSTIFQNAVQATYGVRLRIYTDKKPEETTWLLRNSAGDVVCQGGPYTEARKFVTEEFNLTHDDCYELEFRDSGGDGIKGANGNGYYQLQQLDAEGRATRLLQGDYDGATHIVNFSLSNAPAPERRRLVLFEEFTNTSCDPCAEFSPALNQAVYDRMGQMVAVTYHYNFPSPQDPFYLANPDQVMARANFYGVTGVPALRVDGQHMGAWGYEQQLNNYIDAAGAIAPLADISVEASLSADGTLTVKPVVQNLQSGAFNDLRLFSAVVEERVEWSQPAANGERAWNYVMRCLLPSADGQKVDATQVTPQEFTFTWPVEHFTDQQELGIVTFLQDMATQQVLATTYTPRPTGSPRAAKILKVLNMPDRICNPQFTSDLQVRNTGSETLTSATINVSINGQVQRTPWTGSLEPLGIVTMRTPNYTDFTLNADTGNELELWLSDLNGNSADESVHKTFTISNAYRAANAVRLTLMTDTNPEETTWAVLNSAGDVVCQGGPYTEARKKVVVDLPLDSDDCYLLEFEDQGGDGISQGRGYYMLHEVNAEGKTRLMVQATYGEPLHDVYFSLSNASAASVTTLTAPQQDGQRAYDLQGRPATEDSHIIIYNGGKGVRKR